MSLYIDNGKTVKHFCTSRKVEKAIEALLMQMEELSGSETREGYTVHVIEGKRGIPSNNFYSQELKQWVTW